MLETHRTPEAMAHALCSYIDCDERVLHEVRSEFNASMGVQTVRRIRAKRKRAEAKPMAPMSAGWDWRGDQQRLDAEIASNVFLAAIERERRNAR